MFRLLPPAASAFLFASLGEYGNPVITVAVATMFAAEFIIDGLVPAVKRAYR